MSAKFIPVNNPVLDSEDEYAPLLALRAVPSEQLALAFVVQSSSRPLLDEEQQKGYPPNCA